jgi:hypothetical protein
MVDIAVEPIAPLQETSAIVEGIPSSSSLQEIQAWLPDQLPADHDAH